MPSWRNKPANREHLNKRHTRKEQQAKGDHPKGGGRSAGF